MVYLPRENLFAHCEAGKALLGICPDEHFPQYFFGGFQPLLAHHGGAILGLIIPEVRQ